MRWSWSDESVDGREKECGTRDQDHKFVYAKPLLPCLCLEAVLPRHDRSNKRMLQVVLLGSQVYLWMDSRNKSQADTGIVPV